MHVSDKGQAAQPRSTASSWLVISHRPRRQWFLFSAISLWDHVWTYQIHPNTNKYQQTHQQIPNALDVFGHMFKICLGSNCRFTCQKIPEVCWSEMLPPIALEVSLLISHASQHQNDQESFYCTTSSLSKDTHGLYLIR